MNKFTKIIVSCLLFYQITCSTFGAISNSKLNDIPFGQSSYYHFAKDQKLADLIRDFCSMQSISVVVSPQIVDVVNGKFSKMTPNDFWNYVTRAYGLAWFYDGKILYVYAINEIQTQIFKMGEAESFTLSNLLSSLGFASSDFAFRAVPNANILLVTAPPRYLEVINDLSAKFSVDRLSDSAVVRTFPLKYAWAYDMSFQYTGGSLTVPGVATMLQNILTGNQQQTSSNFTTSIGNNQATRINPMSMEHDNPYGPQRLSINISKDSSGNENSDNQNSKDGKDNKQGQQAVGMITYDTRLNAIIIKDKRENMAFYEDIIRQLDVPCDVIKIDVAIVDLNRTNEREFGVRPEFNFDRNKRTSFHMKGYKVDSDTTASALKESANFFGQTIRGVVNQKTIATYMKAEELNGRSKTIARPSVLTLDNVGAIIEKEQTIYKSVQGKEAGSLFNVTATTKLQVVPHVIPGIINELGKKKIKMFVDVSDATLSGVENSKNDDPQADSSTISTQALLWEGQCLLIGGYFHEIITKSVSGVPILRQIPVVGSLFSVKNSTTTINERLYIIYPTVVDTDQPMSKFDALFYDADWDKNDLMATKANNIKLDEDKEKSKKQKKIYKNNNKQTITVTKPNNNVTEEPKIVTVESPKSIVAEKISATIVAPKVEKKKEVVSSIKVIAPKKVVAPKVEQNATVDSPKNIGKKESKIAKYSTKKKANKNLVKNLLH